MQRKSRDKEFPTIESKHCVQSSRYTGCNGDGGLRSAIDILAYDYHGLIGVVDLRNIYEYKTPCCPPKKV